METNPASYTVIYDSDRFPFVHDLIYKLQRLYCWSILGAYVEAF